MIKLKDLLNENDYSNIPDLIERLTKYSKDYKTRMMKFKV